MSDHGPWWSPLQVKEFQGRFRGVFRSGSCCAGHETPQEAADHAARLLSTWALNRWEDPREGTYAWERKYGEASA